MTFLEKTKRFFEPVKSDRYIFIRWIFVAILWWINWVIHVVFLEKFTFYLLHQPESFGYILLAYAIFLCTYEVINFLLKQWWWVEIEWTTQSYVSEKYLSKFIKIDNNYTESLWTWKLIAIINEWINQWWLLIWVVMQESIRLVIAIGFTVYMIGRIHPGYAIIFVILFILFFVLSRYFNKEMFIYRRIRHENKINISRIVIKILMSKNELLQNNSLPTENKNIQELYKKDVRINKDMWTLRTLLIRNSGFGLAIFLLLIYYFLWFRFLEGKIEISVLVWLSGALIIMQRVIQEALFVYIDFTKHFIKVSTLWEVFDTAPEIKGYSTWSIFSKKSKDIEVQNISYGYNETKVFSDFSLTIKRWQKTALVGASGGGKTTLMKLIAGYLHPESGNISVLGNRLDETALRSYYPHIGYLTQDPGVFDATIRENLMSALPSLQREMSTKVNSTIVEERAPWGEARGDLVSEQNPQSLRDSSLTKELTEQKLIIALKLAQCDFVFDLEKWLDTEIGERGVRLSGGQKQRLAIAKIFLKNPEIILLDEPTSALDSFSEEKITVALDELFVGRTVIIVAHRLQTVKRADDIIVIEWGDVVERWDHGELVAKWGIYNNMLELQSGF